MLTIWSHASSRLQSSSANACLPPTLTMTDNRPDVGNVLRCHGDRRPAHSFRRQDSCRLAIPIYVRGHLRLPFDSTVNEGSRSFGRDVKRIVIYFDRVQQPVGCVHSLSGLTMYDGRGLPSVQPGSKAAARDATVCWVPSFSAFYSEGHDALVCLLWLLLDMLHAADPAIL